MLAWFVAGLGLGDFDWAKVLCVWKGSILVQHICQELGVLVGVWSSGSAHHPTGRLDSGMLEWETQTLLCTGKHAAHGWPWGDIAWPFPLPVYGGGLRLHVAPTTPKSVFLETMTTKKSLQRKTKSPYRVWRCVTPS